MSRSEVEQEDLFKGYTIIDSVHALLGTNAERTLVMKGGSHPKMRLKVHGDETSLADGDGFTDFSFVVALVDTTGNLVVTVEHGTGVIAGRSGAQVTLGTPEPIGLVASATDEPVFEADEDIYLHATVAAGNAADSALIFLKFELVD